MGLLAELQLYGLFFLSFVGGADSATATAVVIK